MNSVKIILVRVVFVLSLFLGGVAGIISANPVVEKDSFNQANVHYKNGEYEKAIKYYLDFLEGGSESSAVYYNLANAYARTKDFGRSILNYERSRLLNTRDADIKANLQYVLEQTDRVGSSKKISLLERLIEGHINMYTFNEMTIIIFFLLCACVMCGLLGRFFIRIRSQYIMTMSILGILLVVFGGGFVLKYQDIKGIAIVLEDSKIRFEPRDNAVVHFNMNRGERLKVIKKNEGWVKIRRKDGKLGWLEEFFVEIIL